MDNARRNKWQVGLAALLIFLLGFAAGALALNAYHARRSAHLQLGRRDRFEQLLDRLQLTQEQRTQVEKILSDTRQQLIALRRESEPKVSEIRRQADDRLQQVLTPAQWQQFQQLKTELGSRRRHRGRDGAPDGRR